MIEVKPKAQTYTIILSCLHTLEYTDPAPLMGEELWCTRCREYKQAVIAPPNYTLTCDHGCGSKGRALRTQFGAAFVTAETHAVKHATKRAGHRVELANGVNHVQTFFHPVMVLDVDIPPF